MLRHVLVAECLSELLPSDVSGVGVGDAVAVPLGLGGSLQLVHGNGDTLLVIAVGEVELGLHAPEPVVGVHQVLRVAERRRLQTDESLNLPVQAFLLGGGVWSRVLNPLLGDLGQVLHPLSLSSHDLNEVRQWWRRLLVLRWLFQLDLFIDFLVLVIFFLCLPLVL